MSDTHVQDQAKALLERHAKGEVKVFNVFARDGRVCHCEDVGGKWELTVDGLAEPVAVSGDLVAAVDKALAPLQPKADQAEPA